MFSVVWSEKGALLKRLMKIHSNPPILYYGFDTIENTLHTLTGMENLNEALIINHQIQFVFMFIHLKMNSLGLFTLHTI